MDKETLCRAFGSLVQRRDEAGGGADVLVEEQTVGEDRLDVFRRDAPLPSWVPVPGSVALRQSNHFVEKRLERARIASNARSDRPALSVRQPASRGVQPQRKLSRVQ